MPFNVNSPDYMELVTDADYAEIYKQLPIGYQRNLDRLTIHRLKLLAALMAMEAVTENWTPSIVSAVPNQSVGVALKRNYIEFITDPNHYADICQQVTEVEQEARAFNALTPEQQEAVVEKEAISKLGKIKLMVCSKPGSNGPSVRPSTN